MPRRKQCNILAGLAGALCLLSAPCAVRAQVSMPTVTLVNGLFRYNYSIRNTSPNDLLDVDIHVLSGAGVVANVVMPTGFESLYDPGLGLVSFFEDAPNSFTATPISGFGFDSAFGPRSSIFDANYTPDGGLTITTSSSNTLAPVPEPGSLALIGALGTIAACALRRRKRGA